MNYGKRKLSNRTESVAGAVSPVSSTGGENQDSAKRKVRNLTEKKRRDQFNQLISELANIVCSGTKKPDKTNVLQMTIEFLKRQKASQLTPETGVSSDDGWKPPFMTDDELLALLMEAGGSFVVVFSKDGTILFITGGASSILGLPKDTLIGKHVSELFHSSDHRLIEDLLQSPYDNCLTVVGESLPSPAKVHIVSVKSNENHGDMESRLVAYERAEIIAMDVVPQGAIPRPASADAELSEDPCDLPSDDYSIYIQLVGHRRSKEFFGTPALHFGTRHSSTFKITHMDESASNVIGFQPSEMLGTPGYLYYHEDDLERIASEHKTLIKAGCCTTAYYRHLTKSSDWVWIRSHYYVTYEMWTGRALVVHGTHYLARPEDVRNNTPYSELIQLGNTLKSGSAALPKLADSPSAAALSKPQSDDEDSSNTNSQYSPVTRSSMMPLPFAFASTPAPAVSLSSSGGSPGVILANTRRPGLSHCEGQLASLVAASRSGAASLASAINEENSSPSRLPQYAYSRIEKVFMKQSIELMKNQRQISEVGDDVEAIMEAASTKAVDAATSLAPSSASPLPAEPPLRSVVASVSSQPAVAASASTPAALAALQPGRRLQLTAVQQRLHEQLLRKYHELQALMELQQQELREVYQHLLLAAPLCTDGEPSLDGSKPPC